MKIITLIIIAFTIFTFNLYSEKNNFSTSSKIINEFNFLIYKNLAKQDVNLFFSPYSISTAIAMTYAGSKGKTEKEIAETMFYNQAGKDIHNLFSQLHKHINGLASDNVKLDSANSLWGSKKYKFNKTYIDFVNKYYAGAFNILDFSKFKKARKTINTWVEEKTHNLIRELIPDGIINTATKLVLVNAIYFKGIWEYKFKKKNTLEKPFHLLNGKDKMVLMMEIQKSYNYCESKEVKVLEIAYKENKVSMIIFLPKIFDGLKKLETKVNLDFYNNHVNKMMISNVKLTLPKYKLESTFKLSKTLKRLGMKRSFSDSADFSLMSPENIGLKIDEVIHKAFVDVNESGTEAAAATAVISRKRGSARRGSKFDHVKFKVDHPFMFFIRDNKSKAILFCGRVLDPCPGIGKIIQRSKDVNNDNEVDSSSTNQYNKFFRLPDPS